MQDRFAFTASYWGKGAVVCRAIEDRPWPVVELEFGEFETWTQANFFATRLNEELDIHHAEAERIITSAFLCTSEALRAMGWGPLESRRRKSGALGSSSQSRIWH
jgi:hypothetical protein